jgi:hypothetical protein
MAKDGVLTEEPGKGNQKLFSINPAHQRPRASPSLPGGEVGKPPQPPLYKEGRLTEGAPGDSLPELDLLGESTTIERSLPTTIAIMF